ncbi:MAG: hypothetical protein IJ574_00995 [Bacilli bacterium]|nr:hypothetical protein [Bacilli bacterium]
MNALQYKILNKYLEYIIKQANKTFDYYVKNHSTLYSMNNFFYDYITSIINYNPYELPLEININNNELLSMAREVIESINHEYLKKFDEYVKYDCIKIDKDLKSVYKVFSDNIEIERTNNYENVATIVHEFIYSLTYTPNSSINSRILSEMMAIYYELYTIDYLIDIKKINPKFIDYNFRLRNTIDCTELINEYSIIILAYQAFGKLDKNKIENISSYLNNFDLEQFRDKSTKLFNEMSFTNNIRDNLLLAEDIFGSYEYLYSTLLAFYNREKLTIEEMNTLLYNINEYEHYFVNELLMEYGIDINDKYEFCKYSKKGISNYLNNVYKSLKLKEKIKVR